MQQFNKLQIGLTPPAPARILSRVKLKIKTN
jgi:hypothetical protein